MATTIVLNGDSKESRERIVVDEDPADVAASLAKSQFPKLTSGGDAVWVNAASVRILKERSALGAGGAGGATGAGGAKGAGAGKGRAAKAEGGGRRAGRAGREGRKGRESG